MSKILISIASLEDPYLLDTMRDAIDKANNPESLTFGLSLQYENEPSFGGITNKIKTVSFSPNIDLPSAPGIIQIRSQIRHLLEDEEYFLQIDAHTRFEKGWDEILVSDLNGLRAINPKTIISAQLWHEPDVNRYTRLRAFPNYHYQLDLVGPDIHGDLVEDPGMNRISNLLVNEKYFLNYYMSGNMYFAHRSFLTSFKFPDYHKFPFEESELSLATFCAGYDVVAPVINHAKIFAGNDNKYHNQTDTRWWIKVGDSWIRKWVFDDYDMYSEACDLMLRGENSYMSLESERSLESFYMSMGCYEEFLNTKEFWYSKKEK